MFDRTLVPLDGSPQSTAALPLARKLAQASHSQITLIRVVTSAAARDEAASYLSRIASEFQTSDVAVATEVCSGIDVASQILWAARDRHADLIVMATHGRSGLQRAVMGSVAESIVAKSTIPLLLVRPGGRRTTSLRKLLVAVDGTPGGALALGNAIALARATGARIVLLQVAVPIPLWMYSAELGTPLAMPLDPSWDDDALTSARTYVDSLAKRLRDTGIDAEGHARIGDVVSTIDSVADEMEADLIVLATHARVGAARAVLGSTADAVVRTARRPVLLVRRRAGQQLASSPVGGLVTSVKGGLSP
jgi:nucleotide-binding universal stress UspA family protein